MSRRALGAATVVAVVMTAPRWLLSLALTALAACASPDRSPATVPAAAPPAAPEVASPEVASPEPVEATPDPRVVRCGIDDQPRRVGSTPEPDDADEPLRELLARPASFSRADAFLGMRVSRTVVILDDPVMRRGPLPALRVERTSPEGRASQAPEGMEDIYRTCAAQAPIDEPLAPLTLGLELASNGALLRVSPPSAAATPTPFVRCLMERSCGLTVATSPGQPTRVPLSLRLSRDGSLPSVSRPGLTVTTLAPAAGWEKAEKDLREAIADGLARCERLTGRVSVQIGLSFARPSTPESVASSRAAPRSLTPGRQRFEPLAGEFPDRAYPCLNGALAKVRLVSAPIMEENLHAEWLLVTWNP